MAFVENSFLLDDSFQNFSHNTVIILLKIVERFITLNGSYGSHRRFFSFRQISDALCWLLRARYVAVLKTYRANRRDNVREWIMFTILNHEVMVTSDKIKIQTHTPSITIMIRFTLINAVLIYCESVFRIIILSFFLVMISICCSYYTLWLYHIIILTSMPTFADDKFKCIEYKFIEIGITSGNGWVPDMREVITWNNGDLDPIPDVIWPH